MLRPEVLDLLGGEKMLVEIRPAKRRASARGAAHNGSSARRAPTGVAEKAAAYGRARQSAAGPVGAQLRPFRAGSVVKLAERLELPVDHLMSVLGITGRTGQRRRQQGALSVEESDRLYRLARVVERAFDVLGSEDAARQWLKRPQAILGGASPLALLGSEAGAQAVEQQLGRIDHGDLY